MKKNILVLVITFYVSISFGRSEDTLSTREILRPLILPKGMWQLTGGREFNFNVTSDANIVNAKSLSITTFLPAHSYSKRMMMPIFPLPYFRILLSKTDIPLKGGDIFKKPSVTLDIGVSNYNIYREEIRESWATYRTALGFYAGLNLKKVINDKLFYYGKTGVHNNFIFTPTENYLIAFLDNELGIQNTDILCTEIKYGVYGSARTDDYKIDYPTMIHELAIGFIINVSNYVSLNIQQEITFFHSFSYDFNEIHLPFYAGFKCQW